MKNRLKNDIQGVAAIEFALILPIILLMLLASVDAVFALTANRKVSTATDTIADIAARSVEPLNTNDIDGFNEIARLILTPFDEPAASIRISGAIVDGTGINATVDWTATRGPSFSSALASGGDVALPANLAPNTFLIIVETELPYTTLFGSVQNIPLINIAPSFTLSDISYFQSRSGNPIPLI